MSNDNSNSRSEIKRNAWGTQKSNVNSVKHKTAVKKTQIYFDTLLAT